MGWCALAYLGIARCDENPQTDRCRRPGLDVAQSVIVGDKMSDIEA